ncbi:hypothetical protein MTsPCn5_16660 [Croceitalea sp. MTPC5]|uniref:BspA family leucine-rich repeat surface protein n=1 Tax=Croceitalea sp. MTPC5 TaxID=3056565 RepID=UPI002B3CBD9C|nr:hypothetical protein MTsPCn5_16660 [Croceitalea sp. MTPC5]
MKNSLKALLGSLVLLLVFACSQDDDSPQPIELNIEDFTLTVPEDVDPTSVLGTLEASTSRGEITFSLTNVSPDGALKVNAGTGELSFLEASLIDFETNPTFTATAVATVEGQTATSTITITITDVDETVLTAQDFAVAIDENPTIGQSLGTISASTTLGDLTFAITQQTPEGAMAINAETGELTVANAAFFDFEVNPTLTAEVEVTANTKSETITATITLQDVMETAPGSIPFIFRWRVSDGESIRLPRGSGFTYDYTVDWGDGTVESVDANTSGNAHVYTNGGIYTVEITGSYPWAPFNSQQLQDAIRSVEQWGNLQWELMSGMFNGARDFNINATDSPDLSLVTDMSFMFQDCSVTTPDFSGWDTSNVTNMQRMFRRANNFNGDISTWNVSNVTNMESMFIDANSFNNDISNWNTEKVTDMELMFLGARSFNQDISSWNVGQVTTMTGMFSGAQVFNQDLNGWDVSNVESMAVMFRNASDFNQNLDNWDVGKVTNMQGMFSGADDFNGNINNWNVANVTSMASMFAAAGGSAKGSAASATFNQDISGWNVEQVTDMSRMFEGNAEFNQNIGSWNVGNVQNMARMFENVSSFNQDIGSWNVANVTNMSRMFLNATAFNQNINTWNVSAVTVMDSMFNGAVTFDQPLDSWDVQNVTNMSFMFRNANSFNQDVGNWNVANVNFFSAMFENASSFNQNLRNWQFTSLANRSAMQSMLDNSGLSTFNYDLLLDSLSNQASNMPLGVDFRGTGLVYCTSVAAHDALTGSFNWTFTDSICQQ